MSSVPQIKIPATYMRGGTSKGVFLNLMICRKELKLQVKQEISCYYVSLVVRILMENKLMEWVVLLRVRVKPLFLLKALSQIMMSITCLVRFQLIKLL